MFKIKTAVAFQLVSFRLYLFAQTLGGNYNALIPDFKQCNNSLIVAQEENAFF